MLKRTTGEKIFSIFNYVILTVFALSTLYPFLYTLTISLSSNAAAEAGGFHILPDFTNLNTVAYKMVFKNAEIWNAYKVTLFRTIVGTVLALLVTCLYAYAISRPTLPFRKFFTSFLIFTMLFSGGQIPTYLNIKSLGLINNVWVYILPFLISAYNVTVAKSFFASLPESLNESAKIDGAGEFRIFFRIVLPLSLPIVMTLALWIAVMHWNEWFSGMMYISDTNKIAVQNYIQRIVNDGNMNLISDSTISSVDSQSQVTPQTIQSASIMVSILPILCFYPFIQKYFVTGVTLGAVKG